MYLISCRIQNQKYSHQSIPAPVLKTYPDQTLVKQRQAYLEDDELAQSY
jgi:hypothetical protein